MKTKKEDMQKFLEDDSLSGHALLRAFDWGFDYEKEIPKMQFPAPGPRPKTGSRPAVFHFSGPVNPATVNRETVLLWDTNSRQLVDADVSISGENAITVRPTDGWTKPSALEVIFTPDVDVDSIRDFSGYVAHVRMPAM